MHVSMVHPSGNEKVIAGRAAPVALERSSSAETSSSYPRAVFSTRPEF